jgi:hypothetical protein
MNLLYLPVHTEGGWRGAGCLLLAPTRCSRRCGMMPAMGGEADGRETRPAPPHLTRSGHRLSRLPDDRANRPPEVAETASSVKRSALIWKCSAMMLRTLAARLSFMVLPREQRL